MIVRTEAVVLRSMKYRDTSRIVTLYTRMYGKISCIVKGARSSKKIAGASLQPMAHVEVVFYKKEGRELQSVTQCDLLTSFRALSEELPKMATGMAIIELVAHIAHEEEENAALYDLLVDSLTAANNAPRDPIEHLFRFQVKLARILGFKPVFDQCVSCGKHVPNTAAKIQFELDRGGPLCSKCRLHHGHTVPMSGKCLHFLAGLDGAGSNAGSPAEELEASAKDEIERLLEAYLRKHVSGVRASKSERVFLKLMSES